MGRRPPRPLILRRAGHDAQRAVDALAAYIASSARRSSSSLSTGSEGVEDRDAEARAGRQVAGSSLGLEARDKAVDDLQRALARAVLEQQGELVAAHPEDRVVVADRADEHARRRLAAAGRRRRGRGCR